MSEMDVHKTASHAVHKTASLAAIPEEIVCRFGEMMGPEPSDASSVARPDQVTVKHTFIELVAPPRNTQRGRSYTDSEISVTKSLTAPSRITGGADDSRIPELSDASTDAPSDVEEAAEAHRFSEWKSPCLDAQKFMEYASPNWGPAGDLYYAGAMAGVENGFPLLPHTDFFAQEEYNWGGMPDEAAWMLPWAAPFDPTQFEQQWQMYDADTGIVVEPAAQSSAQSESLHASEHWTGSDAISTSVCQATDAPMTTIMLRNLPDHFTRSQVIELLEDEGFEGSYDLVYAPMDFGCKCCLGYAFVNFLAASDAARCWTVFDGFSEWGSSCDKLCEVMWSQPHQGVDVLIERYRNSPVMHESVPDEWKPAYFVDGVQVVFPLPTKKIKAPQMKARNKKTKNFD